MGSCTQDALTLYMAYLAEFQLVRSHLYSDLYKWPEGSQDCFKKFIGLKMA